MKTDYMNYYNDKEWYVCNEWTFVTDHGLFAYMEFSYNWLEVRVGPPGGTREDAKTKGKTIFYKKIIEKDKDGDTYCNRIKFGEACRIANISELTIKN